MLIKYVCARDPLSSEITPRAVFEGRRRLLKAAAAAGVWALAPAGADRVRRGDVLGFRWLK